MNKLNPIILKLSWCALIFGYLTAMINGIRMPNLWSVNYFIPSAMEGFYRRSLAGSMLYPLGDLRFQYHPIAAIQITIFIALNIIIIKAWKNDSGSFKWIWPLFLISSAGGYFFHEIGYVDQLLYLLLLVAICCRSTFLGVFLILISLWFHEMALFTTVPLYLAFLTSQHRPWKDIVTVGILFILLFGVLYLFQTVTQSNLDAFLNRAQLLSNYPIRVDYYEIFSNRFTGGRLQWYYTAREALDSFLLFPLWCLVGYAFSLTAFTATQKQIYFLSGFMAALSPMILGIFGWDSHRWIFLSICSITICFYWVREQIKGRLAIFTALFYALFITFGFLDYFDGYIPRFSNWEYLTNFVQGGFLDVFLSIPKR